MGNNQSILVDQNSVWSFLSQAKEKLLVELIDFVDSDDEEYDDGSGIKKRKRLPGKTKEDWWRTDWGQMLQNPNIRDIATREGIEFRRRFRLPG
jgi:hypothetical protein